jgi:hypothetical protein
MEPLVELGPAAPSGLLHLKGIAPNLASQLETHAGMQVSGYLAAAQFNLHKISIHPLHTSPESAGYRSDSMDLISSPRIDFHPVDVLLDRDGSLIVLDTGGWYDLCCPSSATDQRVALGGIYRLRGATSDRRDDSVRWPPVTDVLTRGLAPSRSIDELAKVLIEEPKNEEVWLQIDRLLESKSADVRIAALNLISLYRHEGSRDAVSSCLYHYGHLDDRDARTARLAAECIGRLGMQGKVDGDSGDYLDLLQVLSRYKSDRSMQHAVILAMIDGDEFEDLRESLEKLRLNDSSFTYEPETSGALGFGFRCGFLGLLHMEIVKERLEREFNLALIATAPSVEYRVHKTNGDIELCDNPADLPAPQSIDYIEEPYFRVSIITPKDYTGTLMDLCQTRRGDMTKLEYLSPERVELHYKIPLAEVVVDFFDQMKSRTQGYASLDYELQGYERSNLVKVDLLLNGIPAEAVVDMLDRVRSLLRRRGFLRSAFALDQTEHDEGRKVHPRLRRKAQAEFMIAALSRQSLLVVLIAREQVVCIT